MAESFQDGFHLRFIGGRQYFTRAHPGDGSARFLLRRIQVPQVIKIHLSAESARVDYCVELEIKESGSTEETDPERAGSAPANARYSPRSPSASSRRNGFIILMEEILPQE